MPYLKYYADNHEEFKDAYAEKLSDAQAEYYFDRLKSKWKLTQTLRFYGYGSHGRCGRYTLTLGHDGSLGLLAHEVAHALQYKIHDKHPGKAFKWHSKKHARLMTRVLNVVKNHQAAWNAALEAHYAKRTIANERRLKNTQARNAYKESAQGKLDTLLEAEKRWKSKQKRAETRLKNIQRRIKIWSKKASITNQAGSKTEVI